MPKILLVEGKDDEHVVYALRDKYDIEKDFTIIDCEGINPLLAQIPVRFKESGINTIGIIIDADLDIQSKWDSLKTILKNCGVTLPQNQAIEGTVVKGSIKFGAWIMPNNSLPGMLEDFMQFLMPADDQLMPVAKATLAKIEEDGINKYLLVHKSKALIHTWLSWQESPGTPLGLAITKRYLEIEDERVIRFMDWIRVLFTD